MPLKPLKLFLQVMELDKMKKILYFITTSEWGGASRYVYNLCRFEKEKGNKVYLAVGSRGKLSDKIEELGIQVFIINSVKRNIDPINDLKSILRIRRLIKILKPDIIHLNSSKAGVIGRVACQGIRNRKTKVVFTVHGWAFTDGVPSRLKKSLFNYIEKKVSGLTDLFICVSNYDKFIGKRNRVLTPENNAVVIHNGAVAPQITAINYSSHFPIRLVMIARFSKQKDQESLIRAASTLPRDSYHLTFVGAGETLEHNKEIVSKLQLDKNIEFVGFKENVDKFLINNDVFILSTHYEGLPISIIEAMSYGLPVIASNVGGNDELVENNVNGYLVNSIYEMNLAIRKLINNPSEVKRLGLNSQKKYMSEFTLNRCMKLTDAQYNLLYRKKTRI